MRTLGPPQTAFAVPHPTQSPQTLGCAPESRGRPRRLPSSRKPQEAGGAPEALETPQPSGVDSPVPPRGGPQRPFSRRRRSALWALSKDRSFQSIPNHPPLPAAPLHLTPVLFLCSTSPVSSWQKGISLVFSKNLTPPSLGGLEPPTFRLTAERANRLRHRDDDASSCLPLHGVDTSLVAQTVKCLPAMLET